MLGSLTIPMSAVRCWMPCSHRSRRYAVEPGAAGGRVRRPLGTAKMLTLPAAPAAFRTLQVIL